ncbi:MAG TPA: hypothetical protein VFO73_04550 [Candidatus Limnocylindrales bacterium]|nr:hypothetical protein [Candidatus Limnocylindrales bacterium]
MDARTDRDPWLAAVVAGLGHQCPRGVDRAHGVLVAGQGRHEDADDLVADELVDDGVVFDEDARGNVEEPLHEVPDLDWSQVLAERGGPADVGEEQAALDFRPAMVLHQVLEAGPAVLRVLRPGSLADEPQDRADGPSKRRGAELAAGLRRESFEQPAAIAELRVGPDQHVSPAGVEGRFVPAPGVAITGHRNTLRRPRRGATRRIMLLPAGASRPAQNGPLRTRPHPTGQKE